MDMPSAKGGISTTND